MSTESPVRYSTRRGIAVGLLALVGVALLLGLLRRPRGDASELGSLIAELDRADPNWRLADLDRDRAFVGETENSAALLMPLTSRIPGRWPSADLDGVLTRRDSNRRQEDAGSAKLRAEFARIEPLRGEARKLIGYPRGRFPLAWNHVNPFETDLTERDGIGWVARLLEYDSLQLANSGKITEAIRSAHALVNLGRSLGDDPTASSQSIRADCVIRAASAVERALGLGEAEEKSLADLQALLLNEEKHNGLLLAWRGERAMYHALLINLADGLLRSPADVKFLDLDPEDLWQCRFVPGTLARMAKWELPVALRLANRRQEIANSPAHEWLDASRALKRDLQRLDAPFCKRIFQHSTEDARQHARKLALTRCMIAALAAERFRMIRNRWPESLVELKPDFLIDIPTDPFDGTPLRYKVTPDSIVVHSVGPDVPPDEERLARIVRAAEGAMGYRLWNPEHRNRPALAEAQK